MKLSELGERKIIENLIRHLSSDTKTLGIGDDCAAIEYNDQYLLLSTDMISQQTHIHPQMTSFQIGWFITAINLSDIAAKGGIPYGVLLAMGLPADTKESFLTEIIQGAETCATSYGTHIIGGDTKETPQLILTGTSIGAVPKKEYMSRTGAQPGDIIAVTGTLGDAGLALHLLKNHMSNNQLSSKLFQPQPRIPEGRLLAQTHCITSAMDLSDGLSSSLHQLQKINHVGFEIQQNKLPISSNATKTSTKHQLNPAEFALHTGGDYELLVTLPSECFEQLQHSLKTTKTSITAIGTVTKINDITLQTGTTKKPLPKKGYEHFTPKKP